MGSYQDAWMNGKTVYKGTRECAARYEIIKAHCQKLPIVFSVLDIGANMCYFGLRLIEDFQCNVMAFEFDHFDMRLDHVKASGTNKLMLLERKLKLEDISIMSKCCHFDLVLALSVVHHLPGNTTDWINEFRKLGDNVIIEFALDDSTRPSVRKEYKIPEDGITLGHGTSHLKKDFQRPIVLLTNK